MSKQKDKDKNKTTEAAEVKKPTLSVEEVKKFQGELNKIELEIIRNITDPFKVVQLRKQKDELLIKNGIDPNAPWKKPNT